MVLLSDKYLILENGAIFKGQSFGYDGTAVGQLVFSTKMTGYMETLADPGYAGKIVFQTFPLIGNYGVIPADFGPGPIQPKAYIVRQWCQEPSNFRSEGDLDTFLRDHKTPGLCGIDTRALMRIIRENGGTMRAAITDSPETYGEHCTAMWKE
jgi:carbamoyl-phosphate synthase small subunit